MIHYYNINGRRVRVADAVLRVNDLSILRGYGIFDFFLVRRGQPVFLDDYISRFLNSAQLLYLAPPLSGDELKDQILELIAANGQEEGAIRLVLTGGYSEDGYTPGGEPNLLILQHPMPKVPVEQFEQGVKLITHRYQRELPEVKTINYLMGIRLLQDIKRAGAAEPLYHDGTFLRETVRSNFFLVTPEGRIVTPGSGILFGITRRKVIELARDYYEVEERDVRVEELFTAREAFLTGTTKMVTPVVQVDDHLIAGSRPGPVSQHLLTLLEAYTEDHIASLIQ